MAKVTTSKLNHMVEAITDLIQDGEVLETITAEELLEEGIEGFTKRELEVALDHIREYLEE